MEVFSSVVCLHLLRTCSNKMVNWHDPALILKDYGASWSICRVNIAIDCLLVAAIKLHHAIAGIYMCVRFC
jgi:hypothetical protein